MHVAATPICRICKSEKVDKFLSLGKTPLANSFLRKEQLDSKEPYYPLDVYFCRNCCLVQLVDVVPPEILFRDYVYFSGVSGKFIEHCSSLAEKVSKRFSLSPGSLVIDIGGNDGTLLKQFKMRGVRVLNVEPAVNVAEIAEKEGIKTVNEFWNKETARRIRDSSGPAKIITATNVFAHNDNLDDFVGGVYELLAEDGAFIIEAPYLADLMQNSEFDTIYHEHLSYFSVMPLIYLFRKFGMKIFDIERTKIHGGSIRVYVTKDKSAEAGEAVGELVALEKSLGFDRLETYLTFSAKVESIRKNLVSFLEKLKSDGKKVAGYGAAAKGNTMLNFCKIDTGLLDYIIDKSPHKQGLYTPGMHIPVVKPSKILEDRPDYIVILAWNFADEIMGQEKGYAASGGKFILPIPEIRVI